jgi:hypothetical protein
VQRRSYSDGRTLSHIEYYGQVQGQEHLVQQWNFDDEGSVERIIVFNNRRTGPPVAHEWTFHPDEEFPRIDIHDDANDTSYDYLQDTNEQVYQLHQLTFDGNFAGLIRQYYPHILASGEYEGNREEIRTQLHSRIRLAASRQHEQGVFEDLIREHPIFEHLSEYRVYQVYQVGDEQLFRIASHDRFGRVLHSHAFRYNGDEVDLTDVL